MKKSTISVFVLLFGLLVGQVGFAADEKVTVEKKPAPALAGFIILPSKHSCTTGYKDCSQGCKKTGGANCELDCLSDCNVCALDFGEEALDVCRR